MSPPRRRDRQRKQDQTSHEAPPPVARRYALESMPSRNNQITVMCDTFHPLKLTKFAKELDDGKYWRSWYEGAPDGRVAETADDATGAGLTSHF